VATIQQLDPIYADFTQSAAELNELWREFDTGALQKDTTARVRLILDDGLPYPHGGKLLFSDSTVDPGTGQVTLRGEFPNPNLTLLPGMYVRVLIEQGRHAVDAIAEQAGFGNRERMRRAFLRTIGQPPQTLRRNSRAM